MKKKDFDSEKKNEERDEDLGSFLDDFSIDDESDISDGLSSEQDAETEDEQYDYEKTPSDTSLLDESDFTEEEEDEDNPFDTDRFKLYIKNPSELDDYTVDELAKLIDGKYSDDFRNIKVLIAKPDTIDQIKNSDLVEYITYDDVPVGVITVVNPMEENYLNVIPGEIYSMKTGYNLDGRIEIEYFIISSEFNDYPIGEELLNQLLVKGLNPFMVCTYDDNVTNTLLQHLNFKYISTFNIDVINDYLNLYVIE